MGNSDPAMQDGVQATDGTDGGYVIRDDIEIPPRRQQRRVGPPRKYPLEKLEVGQTFLAKESDNWESVRVACHRYSIILRRQFVTFKTREGLWVGRIE